MRDSVTSSIVQTSAAASIPGGAANTLRTAAVLRPAGAPTAGRLDVNRLIGVPPSLRSTVTSGSAAKPAAHVDGAKSAKAGGQTAGSAVALSDGTSIRFQTVDALPVLEFA